MSLLIQSAAILGAFAASVSAHGHVSGVVVDGTYYEGYNTNFQYEQTPPSVIGWSDPKDENNGFIAPSAAGTPDIICHVGATPGKSVAKVAAGGKVTLQWTPWPESHHGPLLNYLAKCAGDDCTTVTKTDLEFFKIGEAGLVDDSVVPGRWASDDLIANNNSWTVTIPESIAPGQYVLRHEIIALHSAGESDGAQLYPQCINLEVSGSGTATPAGVLGTKLYPDISAPGIEVNIYQSLTYKIPGPALWTGATSGDQSAPPAASSSAVPSTYAAASSSSETHAASSSSETHAAPSSSETHAAPSASKTHAASSTAAPAATSTTTSCTDRDEAPSATAAPATPAAPAYRVTVTNVNIVTAETTVTASGYDSAPTPPSAPAAAISHIASALPSSVLAATISTALPSPASHGNSQASNSAVPGYPSKPLPEGFTLKDLLEWVSYLLSKAFSEAGVHARDFAIRRR